MMPCVYGGNPMVGLYEETKRVAANIPAVGEKGDYTLALFAEDYPEFYTRSVNDDGVTVMTPMLPVAIMERYVESANGTIIPSRWGGEWRTAVGLYVAHLTALRMQTYADGGTPTSVAVRSASTGAVKDATMGDTSLSFDNTALTEGTAKWGAWNLTKYGVQLSTMARMLGITGTFVI